MSTLVLRSEEIFKLKDFIFQALVNLTDQISKLESGNEDLTKQILDHFELTRSRTLKGLFIDPNKESNVSDLYSTRDRNVRKINLLKDHKINLKSLFQTLDFGISEIQISHSDLSQILYFEANNF